MEAYVEQFYKYYVSFITHTSGACFEIFSFLKKILVYNDFLIEKPTF